MESHSVEYSLGLRTVNSIHGFLGHMRLPGGPTPPGPPHPFGEPGLLGHMEDAVYGGECAERLVCWVTLITNH